MYQDDHDTLRISKRVRSPERFRELGRHALRGTTSGGPETHGPVTFKKNHDDDDVMHRNFGILSSNCYISKNIQISYLYQKVNYSTSPFCFKIHSSFITREIGYKVFTQPCLPSIMFF